MKIRTLIADDHPVLLAGFTELLSSQSTLELVAAVSDSTALVDALSADKVDVVVTDFSMPAGNYGDGAAMLGFLQRRFPGLPLVVLTGIEGTEVLNSIQAAGVHCIVAKGDAVDDILAGIHSALCGEPYLSPGIVRRLEGTPTSVLTKRESEVLRLVAEGLTSNEVAARLQRSAQTISSQKRSAMRKLGLGSRAEIFDYAIRHGLVSASQSARDRARTNEDQDE